MLYSFIDTGERSVQEKHACTDCRAKAVKPKPKMQKSQDEVASDGHPQRSEQALCIPSRTSRQGLGL
jgi:hypothetical protein